MNLDNEEKQEEGARMLPDRPAAPAANHMALASMILGIVSFFGICCCGVGGIVTGSLAMILGLLSRTGEKTETRAMAGIITGAVSVILGAAVIILFLIVNIPAFFAGLGGY